MSSTIVANIVHLVGLDLEDLVERDVRQQCTPEELDKLRDNAYLWRQQLLQLKKKTEVQFTASRAKVFDAWAKYSAIKEDSEATEQEINDHYSYAMSMTNEQKQWKSKTNFWLGSIEKRLAFVKQLQVIS